MMHPTFKRAYTPLMASSQSALSQMAMGRMAVVLLGMGVALAGCGRPEGADPRTLPPLVRSVVVGEGAEASETLTGVVRARVESDLGFREAGKIAERLVDPGQTVRKGQPLLRLDARDYALGADAAEGQYQAARAQAERAAADEQRLRGLVKTGAISAQAYDQARAAAAATAEQARSALAQRDVARRQAGFATLDADADGVVMAVSGEVGQVVSAGQPVLRLAHDGPREAVVGVSESRRRDLPKQAEARFLDSGQPPVGATLRQLSQAADPATRTFEARYVLSGPASAAPLGGTVSIQIKVGHGGKAVSVPLGAVVERGAGAGVFVVDGRSDAAGAVVVHRRPVTIAHLEEETATLSAGLATGERVVALGAALLQDGERVRLEPRP